MPCYDKKLEASRPDFATPYASASTAEPIRDVDCVLTTGEVERMLGDKGISLRQLALSTVGTDGGSDAAEASFVPSSLLLQPAPGTSSGGYVHNALSAVLSSLSTAELATARLHEQRIRSEDFVEYSLLVGETVRMKAAKCYGFRNLQNVVRKIGRDKGLVVTKGAAGRMPAASSRRGYQAAKSSAKGKDKVAEAEVEFVEVMACPSGCVNGGGQIAPPKTSRGERRRRAGVNGRVDDEGMPDMSDTMVDDDDGDDGDDERVLSPKEWVAKVEKAYWNGKDASARPQGMGNATDLVNLDATIRPYLATATSHAALVESVVGGLLRHVDEQEREVRRRQLLRTSYRAVEDEEVNGLAVKW